MFYFELPRLRTANAISVLFGHLNEPWGPGRANKHQRYRGLYDPPPPTPSKGCED